MKRTGGGGTFTNAGGADHTLELTLDAPGEKHASHQRDLRPEVGNHRRHSFQRSAAMDVAVATAHRAEGGTQISAGAVEQGFAECAAAGLVADEWGENIGAANQGGAERCANGFLAASEINATDDFAGFVEAG